MKKLVLMFTVTAMSVSMLIGCGNNNGVTTTAEQVEKVSEETEETEAEEAAKEEAAKEAEANEYYEDGRTLLYGQNGEGIDLESAYSKFEKALELGNTDANFYMGVLCDMYNYPEMDYEKAKTYYEASGENPYAKIALAYLYYYGQGVEEDKEKAKEIVQEVDDKIVDVNLFMGSVEEDAENNEKALECYQKATESTEQIYKANSMCIIGDMYQNGKGVEQDYTKAMEWYEKAADLGSTYAMSNVGYMYHMGNGVDQDYSKAIEWYEKAADLRYCTAMSNLGYMYENGNGVEQDYSKAKEWFEKAADLESDSAMCNLGYMYQNGEGVEQDDAKAKELYEKAANLGNGGAMYNLAYMYEHGLGGEQDNEKAQEWYGKAKELGYE